MPLIAIVLKLKMAKDSQETAKLRGKTLTKIRSYLPFKDF